MAGLSVQMAGLFKIKAVCIEFDFDSDYNFQRKYGADCAVDYYRSDLNGWRLNDWFAAFT